MRDYADLIIALLAGILIGFITLLIVNAIININHSSNTELLCGILSDNNISNSTVVMICKEYSK